MPARDPLFLQTLELIESIHRLTPAQARAILGTIPDDCRLTSDAAIEAITGRRACSFDRLTAALLVNARQCGGRSPAVLLELQADLVGLCLHA